MYVEPRDVAALGGEVARALKNKRPASFPPRVFTREGHLASVLSAYARLLQDPKLNEAFGQTQSPARGDGLRNSR